MTIEASGRARSRLDQPLRPDQLDLLLLILGSVTGPLPDISANWPIWAYVEEQYRGVNAMLDPRAVLESLPTVPSTWTPGRPYGHVWLSQSLTTQPQDSERVGLTLSGFRALADDDRVRGGHLGDDLAKVIGDFAKIERRLHVLPDEIPTERAPLAPLAQDFTRWTRERPYSLTQTAIAEVLNHEYGGPVQLQMAGEEWFAWLSAGRMRRYRGVTDLQSYFSVVDPIILAAIGGSVDAPSTVDQVAPDPSEIFIVHGHDGEAKQHVARTLQQLTGYEPTILHEMANGGRTLIEKFEHYGGRASIAVVILTPDDEGAPAGGFAHPRARQNVVFEFGYFAGSLTRSRVVALVKGGIEIPSDLSGVVYIDMDKTDWQRELSRELNEMGLETDLSKVRG